MTSLKKNTHERSSIRGHLVKHLPHSVNMAFLGILLIASLGANLAFLFHYQKEFFPLHDNLQSPVRQIGSNRLLYQGRAYVASKDIALEIYFLKDSTCVECVNLDALRGSFSAQFPNAVLREFDVSSEKGKELLNAGVSVIPAVIFPKSFENSPSFTEFAQNGVVLPISDKYYEFRTGGNKIVLNPEQLPKTEASEGSVIVVGFVDFLSPGALQFFQEIVPALLNQFGDKISFDIRPFASDAASSVMAEAVLCGSDANVVIQKGEVFLASLNETFASIAPESDSAETEKIFSQEISKFADNLSFDATQKSCLENREKQSDVAASVTEANRIGVNGVPAFFIGNHFLGGEQTRETFVSVIAQILAGK